MSKIKCSNEYVELVREVLPSTTAASLPFATFPDHYDSQLFLSWDADGQVAGV
jgi:hypothetical protein